MVLDDGGEGTEGVCVTGEVESASAPIDGGANAAVALVTVERGGTGGQGEGGLVANVDAVTDNVGWAAAGRDSHLVAGLGGRGGITVDGQVPCASCDDGLLAGSSPGAL